MKSPLDRYIDYLHSLNEEKLGDLHRFVAKDVRFKDPFNDSDNVESMRRALLHMFRRLGTVRFTVSERAMTGRIGFLAWHFEAMLRGEPWVFDGTTVLRFNADGLVTEHIDHWDAAGNLYERLPLIGWLLRRLRQSIATR